MNNQIIIIILIIVCLSLIFILAFRRKKDKELAANVRLVKELTEQNRLAKEEKDRIESYYSNMKRNYNTLSREMADLKNHCDEIEKTNKRLQSSQIRFDQQNKEISKLQLLNTEREKSLRIILEGHKKAFPYLAGMMADYLTYDIKILAEKLNWGFDKQREKKVASINSIRASAEERIAEAKVATYQLNYLLSLYPALEDVLDTEQYNELDYSDKGYLQEEDPVRQYLSKEEWSILSEDERNQRALDHYVKSHSKTRWQMGRDYELYVGYLYETKGYIVTYFGETHGLEDLGRDLICQKDGKIQIVQCKYWSHGKLIHEKHIFQLFATTVSYCIDHHIGMNTVSPVFVTNIVLSDEAKRVAEQLNVTYKENQPMGEFPRIKCNNEKTEFGETKIYHLPMDQQYDRVLLNSEGDMKVFTVQEAVAAGYRRAYRWKQG